MAEHARSSNRFGRDRRRADPVDRGAARRRIGQAARLALVLDGRADSRQYPTGRSSCRRSPCSGPWRRWRGRHPVRSLYGRRAAGRARKVLQDFAGAMLPAISASSGECTPVRICSVRPRPVRRLRGRSARRPCHLSPRRGRAGERRGQSRSTACRADRYRHAIICLAGYSDFQPPHRAPGRAHIRSRQSAGQQPGHALQALAAASSDCGPISCTRATSPRWRPTLPAALAGVPVRIHGEHGRDVDDLDGSSTSRQRMRRLFKPFVHRYITVSRDLASYLEHKVGVPPARITQIYNGVNTELFHPAAAAGAARLARLRRRICFVSRHGRAHAGRQGPAHSGAGVRPARARRCRAPSGGCGWR